MAGSHKDTSLLQGLLQAQLETVKRLGDRLESPVTVIDRQFNLLYANPAVRSGQDSQPRVEPPEKCYAVLARRDEPCPVCPSMQALNGRETAGMAGTALPVTLDGEACKLADVFPLISEEGRSACVVQILAPRAEGLPSQAESQPTRETDAAQSRVERLGDVIGSSTLMRNLFELIRLVADSQAPILIEGESGTGKELVAKTIHALSGRRSRPLVVVDCGALPETLLESELFGHVKGAFTGAHASKKGLFEEADGGTIFLDEIADTSLHFQSKLLRVLQEGEVKPVGSGRRIKVDVRVISATNKSLLPLSKAKAFREDLYYRLAVLPVFIPPLRERREDIPLLVRHFVEASCRRHRKPRREVAPAAMQALMQAAWPGNVRQLQHTIERAVVTTRGPALGLEDICGLTGDSTGIEPCVDLRIATRQAIHTAERAGIVEALRQAGGNRAKAARALKISRASLYNKLRAYSIG